VVLSCSGVAMQFGEKSVVTQHWCECVQQMFACLEFSFTKGVERGVNAV